MEQWGLDKAALQHAGPFPLCLEGDGFSRPLRIPGKPSNPHATDRQEQMKTGLGLDLSMAHPAAGSGSQAEPTSQVAGSDSPSPGFWEVEIPFTLQLTLGKGMGWTCFKTSCVWHPCSFGGDGNWGIFLGFEPNMSLLLPLLEKVT